jgi:hypothetical protein
MRTPHRLPTTLAITLLVVGMLTGMPTIVPPTPARARDGADDPIKGFCIWNTTPCASCDMTENIYYCLFPPTNGQHGGCQPDATTKAQCQNYDQDCGAVRDCATGAEQGHCGTERYCISIH